MQLPLPSSAVELYKLAEMSVRAHEPCGRSVERKLAILKQDNAIETVDFSKMMGNDYERAVGTYIEHCAEKLMFCFRVERAERFVNDDEGSVG